MPDQPDHSLPAVMRQRSASPPWIPPRKRATFAANTSPTTSVEVSPGAPPDVPDTHDSRDDSVDFRAESTGVCPVEIGQSPEPARDSPSDAEENQPKVTAGSSRHEPPKYSRRNARCTHCDKRTNRWPGTLCPPCGEGWREAGIPANTKTCTHCGNADTCRWLRGPEGVQTLCNACGKRWLKTGSLEYMRQSDTASKSKSENPPGPKREPQTLRSPECTHCGTRVTRIWRTGPAGRRTLCDECGIRWKRGEEPIMVKKEEEELRADGMEDEEEVDMVAYQPRTKKRKTVPDSPDPAPNHSVSATDAGNDGDDNEDEHSNSGPSSSRGNDSNAPSACSKALGVIDELEKGTGLVQFALQSSQPNLERLEAVNRFISIGLRNLREETMRAISD